MKVLNVLDSLGQGGLENGVVGLAEEFIAMGWQYRVATLRGGGLMEARLRPEAGLFSLDKGDGFSFGAVRRLAQWIGREKPDIVHSRNLGPLIYCTLALALPGTPRVPHFHSEHAQFTAADRSPRHRFYRKIGYRRAAALACLSHDQQSELRTAFPGTRWTVLPNGVDLDRFAPAAGPSLLRARAGIPDEAVVFGVIGRFGSNKGHEDIIEAFGILAARFSRAWLVLAGDGGPRQAAVESMIGNSPFRDRIVMLGYQADMPPVYHALDILVSASTVEGMSNAVLEALACGVPVLAREAAGMDELVSDGATGWIYRDHEARNLAARMQECLECPDRPRMAREARASAAGRGRKTMAGNYRCWYEQTLPAAP